MYMRIPIDSKCLRQLIRNGGITMIKTLRQPMIAASLLMAAVLAGFYIWYQGNSSPLTSQEQSAYMARVSALQELTQGFLDAAVIEEFLSTDDGRSFFVINLFKFRPHAVYADGRESAATGANAFKQFSQAVMPVWLSRGTHPAFFTEPTASIKNDWDLVSVVRYRSRRDYVEIITDAAFLAALPHRLAAAERNIRIQLPGIIVPNPLLALFAMLVSILAIVCIFQTRKRRQTST
jgi:hypothetical protein